MKKLVILACCFGLVFILSGCTKKTGTNTTTTAGGVTIPDTVSGAQTTSGSSTTSGSTTTSSSTLDTTALDTTYQRNYTEALQTANASLQNKAVFCSAIVEFSPGTVNNAKESFLFTSDISGLKDYYWVVVFEPFSQINKKRVLVAKNDFKDDITCQTSPTAIPPSFTTALSTINASGTTLPDQTTVARTIISLQNTAWNFVQWSKDAQVLFSQQIPILGTAASSTSATTQNAS